MIALCSASSLDGVLANDHADASSRCHAPSGGLVISRAREEGGELWTIVPRNSAVGEAQPLLSGRLVGVEEVVTECVPLPSARLGLHLEEAALDAVLGLDFHILPPTAAL